MVFRTKRVELIITPPHPPALPRVQSSIEFLCLRYLIPLEVIFEIKKILNNLEMTNVAWSFLIDRRRARKPLIVGDRLEAARRLNQQLLHQLQNRLRQIPCRLAATATWPAAAAIPASRRRWWRSGWSGLLSFAGISFKTELKCA